MTQPRSPRPLSIKMIVILYFVQTFGTVVGGPHTMLGLSISPILLSVVHLCLGVGLWKLSNAARLLAIAYEVLSAANFLWSIPQLYTYTDATLTDAGHFPGYTRLAIASITIVPAMTDGVIIWFLIKCKSAFRKPAQLTQPPSLKGQ